MKFTTVSILSSCTSDRQVGLSLFILFRKDLKMGMAIIKSTRRALTARTKEALSTIDVVLKKSCDLNN